MTTLREAAQQALEALEYHVEQTRPIWKTSEAIAALEAALAEPVQDPVAWRWGYRSVTTGEMDWRGYVEIAAHPNLRSPAIIMEPLYTAPPQRKPEPNSDYERGFVDGMSEQARRSVDKAVNAMTNCKPLAEEEIARLVTNDMVKFARAIERAHGIGEQQ